MCHLRRMRNVRVYHPVHADTKAPFNLKRVKSESICRISFQSAHPLNNLLKFIPENSVAFLVRHDQTRSSWHQAGSTPTPLPPPSFTPVQPLNSQPVYRSESNRRGKGCCKLSCVQERRIPAPGNNLGCLRGFHFFGISCGGALGSRISDICRSYDGRSCNLL